MSKVGALSIKCRNFALMLESTCPRCGKIISVSDEVLLAHDFKVVCPQCLAVYTQLRDGLLVPAPEAPSPSPTPAAEVAHHYCMHCGVALPDAARYCYNCGQPLPGVSPVTTAPVIVAQSVAEPAATPSPAQQQPLKPAVSDFVQGALPFTFGPFMRQPAPPASVTMRIVGYTVIFLLLAVLGIIIYAAVRL